MPAPAAAARRGARRQVLAWSHGRLASLRILVVGDDGARHPRGRTLRGILAARSTPVLARCLDAAVSDSRSGDLAGGSRPSESPRFGGEGPGAGARVVTTSTVRRTSSSAPFARVDGPQRRPARRTARRAARRTGGRRATLWSSRAAPRRRSASRSLRLSSPCPRPSAAPGVGVVLSKSRLGFGVADLRQLRRRVERRDASARAPTGLRRRHADGDRDDCTGQRQKAARQR